MRRTRTATTVAAALLLTGLTGIAGQERAAAADPIDIDGGSVKSHVDALGKAASDNGGNRAAGTPGYTASSDYVQGQLENAGYTVEKQEFTLRDGTRTWNLIVEIEGQDPSKVSMFGAHLDGVEAGPGLNDNGSGSAVLLANAVAYKKAGTQPATTVRFAFWGAEELGLIGSAHYVDNLPEADRSKITGYVNYDMMAAKNAGYFHYGTGSTADDLVAAYKEEGVETEPTDIDGRSDHASFEQYGIPTAGIFSGMDDAMSQEQASKWGGTAGQPFDACYHQSCDDETNISETALDRGADVMSRLVTKYGFSSTGAATKTSGTVGGLAPAA